MLDAECEAIHRRRHSVLAKIIALRRETINEDDFGRLVAPLIDSLISDEAADPRQTLRRGRWDDGERQVLRESYSTFDYFVAVKEAAKRLNRTEQQIRSMAANMGLK